MLGKFKKLGHLLRTPWYLHKEERKITVDDITTAFPQVSKYDVDTIEFFRQNEYDMLSKIVSQTSPDDVVLDIGAHIGFQTCFLAQVANTVYSFEPDPKNVKLLRRNIEYNNVENSVDIFDVAVSKSNDTVEFGNPNYERNEWSGKASINPDKGSEVIKVDTVRIDDLVAENRIIQPSILKIDVEGAEGLVIDGAIYTIRSGECHTIFCEIHNDSPHRKSVRDYGYTQREILSLLSESGFNIEMVEERGSETHVMATK